MKSTDKKHQFLWGGATSSSQYEGGFGMDGKGIDTQDCRAYQKRTSNATQTTRLLNAEAIRKAKDSKDESLYVFRSGSEGISHLDEDLDLLVELGIDCYRFSISWARLFPKGIEKEANEKAIQYYDKLIKRLHTEGMKIFLTLNHFAMPLYLVETYGGWKNRKVIYFYLNFVESIFSRWGAYIDYVLPFNEINAGYFSPYNGLGLLKGEDGYNLSDIFQGLHHQFLASAKTIAMARGCGTMKVGCMVSSFGYYAFSASPSDNLKLLHDERYHQWFYADVLMRGIYPSYMDHFFKEKDIEVNITKEDELELQRNTADFVSFSYYQSSVISDTENEKTAGNLVVATKNPYLESTSWGWQIDPIGLRISLNKFWDRYQKPIFIAENGMGEIDELTFDNRVKDDYRIQYLKSHFIQIEEALKEGVDILGYFLWGVIDLVSAGSCEREKRYGVIYVDANNQGVGTFARYKKDSFYWYKDFIKTWKKPKGGKIDG